MGEEGVSERERRKCDREKTTRTRAMLQDEVAKPILQGGGSQSFPSHFQSFALLSVCFGMLTGLNPALRWDNSPNQKMS